MFANPCLQPVARNRAGLPIFTNDIMAALCYKEELNLSMKMFGSEFVKEHGATVKKTYRIPIPVDEINRALQLEQSTGFNLICI
ncbi:hypothetical protein SAMN05444277_10275 [Parafilimonas terrae]|uniref:Uncharacterized protein n=1 Tax=Parafilimonas terrae TaxID=1465490 RepID=A0A1I5TDX9_9BACT|nr:hypothetical protein SAMN05444277_10275 [Parafilimonas terrae]